MCLYTNATIYNLSKPRNKIHALMRKYSKLHIWHPFSWYEHPLNSRGFPLPSRTKDSRVFSIEFGTDSHILSGPEGAEDWSPWPPIYVSSPRPLTSISPAVPAFQHFYCRGTVGGAFVPSPSLWASSTVGGFTTQHNSHKLLHASIVASPPSRPLIPANAASPPRADFVMQLRERSDSWVYSLIRGLQRSQGGIKYQEMDVPGPLMLGKWSLGLWERGLTPKTPAVT